MHGLLNSGQRRFDVMIGVGGIGSGILLELEGNTTLGRNESRAGKLLDVRDYCKLHIVSHYVAVLLATGHANNPFRVVPFGKVGGDVQASTLLHYMRSAGIDTGHVEVVTDRPTLFSVAFQYPDGSGGNITTNNSAAAEIAATDLDGARPIVEKHGARSICLSVPEAPLEARHAFLEMATDYSAFRVASFLSGEIGTSIRNGTLGMVDLLSVNEDEAGVLIGKKILPEEADRYLDALGARLNELNPDMDAILTLGSAGAYSYSNGLWSFSYPVAVEPASTAGAGDALLGATIAAAVLGVPLGHALDFGAAFAALTVTSPHTIHPEADAAHFAAFMKQMNVSLPDAISHLVPHVTPTGD